jgi:hypothetical protein
LNKSKRKEELEDLAIALALPEGGKKDDLFQRISDHFEQHPGLKTNPRFEGLFNSRPSKRARGVDFSTAGSSTVHGFTAPPTSPPTHISDLLLNMLAPANTPGSSTSMIHPQYLQLQHTMENK